MSSLYLPGMSPARRAGQFLTNRPSCCRTHARVPRAGLEQLSLESDLANLDRRVEALCPVRDGALAEHIRSVVLDTYARDIDRAYLLCVDGCEHAEPPNGIHVNAHEELLQWYAASRIRDDASADRPTT